MNPPGTNIAELIALMRTRRVCRSFTDEPVDRAHLQTLVTAARFAPSASNQRINKFLVVADPHRIRLLRSVAPGMLGVPAALIVILTDTARAAEVGVRLDRDLRTRWADVGAAAENILLAAEALGLGACPLMSFSVEGARAVLELPPHLVPDYVVQLGHPAADRQRSASGRKSVVEDLVFWEQAR
jgi:nitroreductase